MELLILKENKVVETNESYGARLIEQGEAVLHFAKAAEEEPEEVKAVEAEAEAAEKPSKKGKK